MKNMHDGPYPVIVIRPESVLEPEVMGSKDKFWYRGEDGSDWLFKFPQPNTGQHWAEKVAAELADALYLFHARVELAVFEGYRGSATQSFVQDGRELYHGNQILAGQVLGYDPGKQFGQADHTLANVFLALERVFKVPGEARKAKERIAEYLVLDALIGNTDRHHENWGILRERTPRGWFGMVAPTFDHASSLGRELRDEGEGRSRRRLLEEGRLSDYLRRARGAVFWSASDKHGPSPLELVRRARALYPDVFAPALACLDRLDSDTIDAILTRVPEDWMSPLARTFARELLRLTLDELRRLTP